MTDKPIRLGSIALNQGIHWVTASITALNALPNEYVMVGIANVRFASARKEPQ